MQVSAPDHSAEPVISFQNVSKRFARYPSLKARLASVLFRRPSFGVSDVLRDINLTIRHGESVAILGGNGAGKTTMLSLIAKTNIPTRGRVSVRGSVGALLELGVGFHPAWTGRQNAEFHLRLNGTPKSEIHNRLADVANFADIGSHFDLPLRTYSSGMTMRVAFAAAIATDPDILLIDETLAVGDTSFQHKCFQWIADFRESGRTMLLVTHRIDIVPQLCSRALVISGGQINFDGNPIDAVLHYCDQLYSGGASIRTDDASMVPWGGHSHAQLEGTRMGAGGASISAVSIVGNVDGHHKFKSGQPMLLDVDVKFERAIEHPFFSITLKSVEGIVLYCVSTLYNSNQMRPAYAGEVRRIRVDIPLRFPTTSIFVDIAIATIERGEAQILDGRFSALRVDVEAHAQIFGLVDLEGTIEELPVQKQH